MLKQTCIAAFLVSGAIAGCGNDNSLTTAVPACPGTTEEVQAQIFAASCGTSGCHGAVSPALGLDLISPGLEHRIINASANGCGDKTMVIAGDPERSYLFAKLLQDSPDCGERMPLGGTPLSATQVDCLKAWVRQLASAGTDGTTSMGGQSNFSGQAGSGGQGSGSGGNTVGAGGSTGGGTSTGGQVSNGGNSSVGGSTSMGGAGGQVNTGGQVGCGPTVSFSSRVQPIFTANCTSAGCHTGNRPAASLSLASGASYAELVNVAASSCSSRVLVKPSVVSQSYLVSKLLGQDLCNGSQMPKAGTSLPSADIAAISGWICQGAPKN